MNGLMPAGLMTGRAGAWMVSYTFAIDRMRGNLAGTGPVTDAAVLRTFGTR